MLNSIAPKELPVYFCYLFIVYPLQAYVCIGLMFISVYFIVKTIKQYRETRQTGQKIFNVRMVYFLILAFISSKKYRIFSLFDKVAGFICCVLVVATLAQLSFIEISLQLNLLYLYLRFRYWWIFFVPKCPINGFI